VDAAHFVMGAFLGFLWSVARIFVRSSSGRKRFSVLGALCAVTNKIVTVTTDSYINSDSVCALLRLIREKSPTIAISCVMDNAAYQRCAKVKTEAERLHIELLFLPPYSPNLNLIERLWKFVKKNALNNRHYETYAEFCAAIRRVIEQASESMQDQLRSLLVLNFQTFDPIKS
jgi:transposase